MDKKSYDNGTDFSFVEQKVREVQTTIENAVKTTPSHRCEGVVLLYGMLKGGVGSIWGDGYAFL